MNSQTQGTGMAPRFGIFLGAVAISATLVAWLAVTANESDVDSATPTPPVNSSSTQQQSPSQALPAKCSADGSSCLSIFGTSELPFLAEEGVTRDRAWDALTADLIRMYSQASEARRLPVADSTETLRASSARTAVPVAFLDLSTSYGYVMPKPLLEEFGAIVELGGQEHIWISRELHESYRQQLMFLARQPARAVEQLNAFITRLNALSARPTLRASEVLELYYLEHVPTALRSRLLEEVKAENPNPFGQRRARLLSLLALRNEQIPGPFSNVLVGDVLLLDPTQRKPVQQLPVVYVDGTWKIAVAVGE